MKEVERELCGKDFARCHASYIVKNIGHRGKDFCYRVSA